ncbi:hypothetical protein PTTG_12134, partial [Puccinia triticina 1-1 BBBD Race 1]
DVVSSLGLTSRFLVIAFSFVANTKDYIVSPPGAPQAIYTTELPTSKRPFPQPPQPESTTPIKRHAKQSKALEQTQTAGEACTTAFTQDLDGRRLRPRFGHDT